MDKSIKKLLGITDLNIEFDDTQPEQFHEEVIKDRPLPFGTLNSPIIVVVINAGSH